MKKLSVLSAFAYPCGILGTALLASTCLLGTTGCGAFGMTYSLTGLTVLPKANSTCVPPGSVAQFKAYGTYTEGGHMSKVEDISSQVSWTVPLPELAKVDTSGLATAATNYVGTTAIVASIKGEFGILTSASSLQVSTSCSTSNLAVRHGFMVVPARQNLAVGEGLTPLAIVPDIAGGHGADWSRQAAWTSSDPKVAVVDAHGLIRAVGPGDATVTAVARGGAGSATTAIHVAGSIENQ
jgi:uncharacterized protein YjdB